MRNLKELWPWSWMPFFVFTIGILSISLVGVVVAVAQRLVDEALIEAMILDARGQAAMARAELDLVIAWDSEADPGKVTTQLDQAIYLLNAVVHGGETNVHGVVMPLKDPELSASAEAVKYLIVQMKKVALVRLGDQTEHADALDTDRQLQSLFRSFMGKASELVHEFESREIARVKRIRLGLLGVLSIWMVGVVASGTSIWKTEKRRKAANDELARTNKLLGAQASELAVHRDNLVGLVENRTVELAMANQHLQLQIAECRQTEGELKESERTIRHLSSKLINAQEKERKRISMELHDELGQALNAVKLHIMVIGSRLKDDQGEIRKTCEELHEYLNQVIENVRRLSLDLSPASLEDLGLRSSLQWLFKSSSKTANLNVTYRIPEIDRFFHQNHWITIYRVIQEALTNIVKHAQAKNISVVVERDDDTVTFSVEDDGQGFDPKQVAEDKVLRRGLGLITMKERVRMMGGAFELSSHWGQGTRITFTIPAEKGVRQYG